MKIKFRYVPPLLVDMRGTALCGEFNTCSSGGMVGAGASCQEDTSCRTGGYAERCQTGNSACGCDACCQSGSGYTTKSGLPNTDCECQTFGTTAQLQCAVGDFAGSACTATGGYAGSSTCSGGGSTYAGMNQWCGGGSD
jgi:hypothetical protein